MKTRSITLTSLLFAAIGLTAASAAGEWLTGPKLIAQLSDPVDMVWSENPLRDALAALARAQNVAVLLDRRIDPSRKLTISVKQSPLSEVLTAVALSGELGVTLAGPVAYFGPADAVPKLRTLIFLREEEARKMPTVAAKMWLQERPLAWNDFAQPREILQRLGRDNRLTISGLKSIPYDLWAAADLPPMTLVERLALIAFQYDLTFSYAANGRRIELAPIPPDIRLARSYPGGRKLEETAKRFAELAPHADIETVGDTLLVKGLLEDHERIEAPPPPPGGAAVKNAPPDFSRKRFDLTIAEKPIGPVLKQLAEHLGLQLQMDESAIARAGVSLDQRVSFKVENATIDELLQAAIEKTPLKFRRQGTILKVEALKKNNE
jgi:hypothetical protein